HGGTGGRLTRYGTPAEPARVWWGVEPGGSGDRRPTGGRRAQTWEHEIDVTEVAMDVAAVLTDLYGRVPDEVRAAVEGLSAEELATSPEPGGNTIGWLVWHLTRVQDAQIADLMDAEQVWTADGWAARFGMDPDPADTGYGHSR